MTQGLNIKEEYSVEDLKKIARKSKSKEIFNNLYPKEYQYVLDNNLLTEIFKSYTVKSNYTIKELRKITESYKNTSDFKRDYPKVYEYIKNKKIEDKAYCHNFKHRKKRVIFEKPPSVKKLVELSKKCKNVSEFKKKHSGLYKYILRENLLLHVFSHFYRETTFSIEYLKKIAKPYKTSNSFIKYKQTLYNYITKHKIGAVVFSHFPRIKKLSVKKQKEIIKKYNAKIKLIKNHSNKFKKRFSSMKPKEINKKIVKNKVKTIKLKEYSDLEIHVLSSNFTSVVEFKAHFPWLHKEVNKRGLANQFYNHMPTYRPSHINVIKKYKLFNYSKQNVLLNYIKQDTLKSINFYFIKPKPKWNKNSNLFTLEEMKNLAIKYTKRINFMKDYPGLSQRIYREGMQDIVFSHIPVKRAIKMSDEEIQEICLKYSSCRNLKKDFPRIEYYIKKNKLQKKFFSHVKYISKPEEEILFFVNLFFPMAKSKFYKGISVKRRPYIKGFQIDILIEELNLGIEVDGIYWHSFSQARKCRPHWPENAVKKLKHIKDNYFKQEKGITILHVTDAEWFNQNQVTKEKIKKFLKITS